MNRALTQSKPPTLIRSTASAAMLSVILPPGIVSCEQFGKFEGNAFPEEMATLRAGATLGRREQFAAGRACAHAAMHMHGRGNPPLLRGRRGEPLWPRGMVGSITHCDGYCAAAVADEHSYTALGIDAERNHPLPKGVLEIVASGREADWVRLAPDTGVCRDRLLFSAKESVYKAWYPHGGAVLEFCDAEIVFDSEHGRFLAMVHRAQADPSRTMDELFLGRYVVDCEVILTSAVRCGDLVRAEFDPSRGSGADVL